MPDTYIKPFAADELIVSDVTFSKSADVCGAITGQRVTVSIPLFCNALWLTDCECKIELRGAINYTDTFGLSREGSITKQYSFTMPSNNTTLSVKVSEVDPTFDNIEYDNTFSIANVSQEERDACAPVVPPIDLTKIDPTFVVIGATLGGITGIASEGKEGFMSFALIGGGLALAYSYLTATTTQ